MFTLKIETGNAAFGKNRAHEIARILREAADQVEARIPNIGESVDDRWPLRDLNGNTVGHAAAKLENTQS